MDFQCQKRIPLVIKEEEAQRVQNTQLGKRKIQKTNGMWDTYSFISTMQVTFSEVSETGIHFFLTFHNISKFNAVNRTWNCELEDLRSGPDSRIN